MRRSFSFAVITALSFALAGPADAAQGSRPTTGPATQRAGTRPATTRSASRPTSQGAVADSMVSARATMRTFLVALNEAKEKPGRISVAIGCLDLSKVSPEDRASLGPKLAEQLGAIIQSIGVQTEVIPDDPAAKPYVFSGAKDRKIILAPQEDDRWRFTAETVAQIPAMAANLRKTASAEPARRAASTVDPAFISPRATMQTFLAAADKGDFSAAAKCLDLSDLAAGARNEAGQSLAQKLRATIHRTQPVILQEIPDESDGSVYPWYIGSGGRIELERQESGPAKGQWLFSRATVKNLEGLYREMSTRAQIDDGPQVEFWNSPGLWVREHAPSVLTERKFLFLEVYQWVCLAVFAAIGLAIKPLILRIFQAGVGLWLRRRDVRLEPALIGRNIRPVVLLMMLAAWWGALRLLDLDVKVQQLLWPPFKFCSAIIAIWAFYRLTHLLSAYYDQRLTSMNGSAVFPMLVPLISKTLRVLILACGAVVVLRTLDQDVGALLTGLGLGGLAFALAAQDTLKNFFGSLTLLGDRPFHVGDYVKINAVEGTVERVGLRSTRIRTFYDSVVTVPNAELTSSVIDNMGVRRWRRFRESIGLIYATPVDKLQAYCREAASIMRNHPRTRKDFVEAHVHALSASSIELLLCCYIEATSYSEEIACREQLLLDLIRLASTLEVEFAFPTQTVHLERDASSEDGPPRRWPSSHGESLERRAAARPGVS